MKVYVRFKLKYTEMVFYEICRLKTQRMRSVREFISIYCLCFEQWKFILVPLAINSVFHMSKFIKKLKRNFFCTKEYVSFQNIIEYYDFQ